MPGIAGHISFEGAANRGVVESMLTAMTTPLDMSQHVYSDGVAAMGGLRRTLGAEPLAERSDAVVAADATLYEDKEDGALAVADCFSRRGKHTLRHLRGDFAAAVWQPARRRLVCLRDQIGVRALFYASLPTGFYFCSNLQVLADHLPPSALALDRQYLFDWLIRGTRDWPRTPYGHVRRVVRGNLVIVTTAGITTESYWSPETLDPLPRSTIDEYAGELRRLLTESVHRRIAQVRGPIAIALSGGQDSSGIAAIAASVRRDAGTALVAVSGVFDRWHTADEREYARALCRHCGIRLEEVVSDHLLPFRAFPLGASRTGEPDSLVSQWWTRACAKRAKVLGATVMIGRDGGDSLFGGHHLYLGDLLRRGRLGSFCRQTLKVSRATKMSLGDAVRHFVLTSLTARRAFATYNEVPEWVDERKLLASGWSCARLPQFAGTAYDRCNWEGLWRFSVSHPAQFIYEPVGIEKRSPIWDLKIMEFCMRLPWWAKLDGADYKPVYCRAIAGLVPPAILRRDITNHSEFLLNGARRYWHLVERVVRKRRLADLGLVNERYYHRLAQYRHGMIWGQGALLNALGLEAWLEARDY